ncbi:Capsule assembly protein Wzi [Salinimicrobium catena]|uniref:Capsule assembly protein Wzi n=1 Tax=Salinimicrobium catena TaxID=390640 RepID=A0A1H5PDN5_9FLAO|nr:capsule assembly Wzi family protein [Salinimicrobium catena]SDL80613.1 Capsule assembly protein Wzi [Salinimicrobium catena]SEF12015.1 Capsule assembly protein Wzi [Salinimicrobium catena]
MRPLITLLLLLSLQTATAQFSWNAEANLKTMAGTEDELPFWMVHNQRGRILEDSNFAGWITGRSQYTFNNNSVLEVGAGFLGREGSGDNLFVDELYAHYETKFWSFTAGRKQQEEIYNGLSVSNRSILWSLNARPLPGLQLETTRPIFLLKNFGFEAAWEEHLMDDTRFVDNARVHHKSFHLVYSSAVRDFQVKAGIQHFVQWGGESPVFGKQPTGINDYLRIFTGREGGTNAVGGDQKNALGNHLGGYELFITKKFSNYEIELLYNHLFEDGSGTRLGNTPDGRYGIFIDFIEKDQWINSLIYEFYYTKHQSHTTSGAHISDNYFNNGVYVSGWTYNNQVIGAPFFLINYYDENYGRGFVRIGNNIFVAHHLGIEGLAFDRIPFQFLSAYVKNYGHKRIAGNKIVDYFTTDDPLGKYILPSEILSSYLDLQIIQSPFRLNLQLSADFSSEGFTGGAGLHLVYSIE